MAVHRWESEIVKASSKENICSSEAESKFMSSCVDSSLVCERLQETVIGFINWSHFYLDYWSFVID